MSQKQRTKTVKKVSKKVSKQTKTPVYGRLGPYKTGDTVVIRAIPFHYIGTIEHLGEHSITLAAGAVWLADSKRWGSEFLLQGQVNEAEPFPNAVVIGFGVIADVTAWPHKIPGQV